MRDMWRGGGKKKKNPATALRLPGHQGKHREKGDVECPGFQESARNRRNRGGGLAVGKKGVLPGTKGKRVPLALNTGQGKEKGRFSRRFKIGNVKTSI